MNRIEVSSGRRLRLAVGFAVGISVSVVAAAALAQTSYDQRYSASATRDDPNLGPVSDSSSQRSNFFPYPVTFFTQGSASVSRTDILPDGTGLYFGSASSNAGALAGDRFVKASAFSSLDFTTGRTSSDAGAIWSSRATPGKDALVDVSVLLARSLYFGDFLSNTDRGNQILDFATANVQAFDFAEAFTLSATVSLNVLVREVETGVFWNSFVQEEVNRSFVLGKYSDGITYVSGGIGDRAYSIFRTGTNISGIPIGTEIVEEHPIDFNSAQYPPTYGTQFSSIFGVDNLFLHAGRTYDISLDLSCYSSVLALSGLADPSAYSAGCDASNSAYWLGLTDFRDFEGNTITPVSFTSTDTGLDLSRPSPSAPGGSGPIPEPGTWALMIGGFGLAGAALRRRRAAA